MLESLYNLFRWPIGGLNDPVAVIFELLLIGLSINWCVGVLHGTRGTRLLKGLLIILVVATLIVRLLSAQMGWTRLELLYRYFVIALAFIALVAFQPELRRAFLRAGDVRLLRRGTPRSKVISALAESAGYLSRNHYGALLALEREVGLRNWAENGTLLNAEVSAKLLNSIFYPNSALHDLGVIIQGDRVLAANCQFPQAESDEMETALGSRHRAAVGLSNESDALVVVVSEETGTISLADRGKLVRFLSLEQLADELVARLGHAGSANGRRTRGFQPPDWLRLARRFLVVMPLTLVIWYLADQASQTQETVKAELNIRAEQDPTLQVDLLQPQPAVFSVTVRGSLRAVEELRNQTANKPLSLNWTLPGQYAEPGERVLDTRLVLDSLPALRSRGVSAQAATPSTLQLAVDRLVTVRVPVRLQTDAGRVVEARFDPPEVQVTLRSRDWESVREDQRFAVVRADEPQLRALGPNQTAPPQNLPVAPLLGGKPLVHRAPAEVNATLRVVSQKIHRRLSGIVVELVAPPQLWQQYDLELRDRNEWIIDLEVEGEKAVVEALKPQNVRAFVTLTGERTAPAPAFRSEKVTVLLPDGVEVVGAPREVQFRLLEREGGKP